MPDNKDDAAQKADSKAGRRASLTFVPPIARRVRQPESAVASEKKETQEPQDAKDQPFASQAGPKVPGMPVTARKVGHDDDDVGGAEIPDIPLRHRSASFGSLGSSFGTSSLERMMAPGSQHTTPFGPSKLRPEKMYEGQCDDLSLYPVSECSWESSLPDNADVCCPKPSLEREANSSSNLQRQRPMSPPARNTTLSQDQSVALPDSPVVLRASTPLQREATQPRVGSSPAASFTTSSIRTEPLSTLPPLQANGSDDLDGLHSVEEECSDSNNFDLVIPTSNAAVYSLERRSELLFSAEHLRVIFSDPIFLHRFAAYVHVYRPHSMPLLGYTLDALKAIRAMEYANQIISQSLRVGSQQYQLYGLAASVAAPELTRNESLRQSTAAALEALAREELPAYITHVWTEIVEVSLKRKITGTMQADLQILSEGLAEVFCISDPSRQDNPIVFASEEFHRTTQYGPDYVMGRNCRFLQGPKTNPHSIQRLRDKLMQGKEHYECFLNYRRDGLPFMNLLMCTPLLDAKGAVRYFLGAQVDVSSLAKDCSGLESLRRLVDEDERERRRHEEDAETDSDFAGRRDSGADVDNTPVGWATTTSAAKDPTRTRDRFRLLAEMFSRPELETVRRFGGHILRSQQEQGQHLNAISNWHKPRVVLQDQYEPSPPSSPHGFRGGVVGPGMSRQSSSIGQEITDANGNITLSLPSLPSRASSTSSTTLLPRGSASSLGGARGRGALRPSLPAIFENYLVVRPYPSLRILFASPSLRVPGTLQSHLMSRIGGSHRIHQELEHAFAMGQSVTAKVKWLPSVGLRSTPANPGSQSDASSASTASTGGAAGAAGGHESIGREGRPRWIHCTPLLGANGSVGVWVVVLIDDDAEGSSDGSKRRRREASVPVYADGYPGGGGGTGASSSWKRSGSARGGGGPPGGRLSKSPDEMSLADYASMNRLPEDEELRKHVREMYDEARRRERAQARDWERGWGEPRGYQKSELRPKGSVDGSLSNNNANANDSNNNNNNNNHHHGSSSISSSNNNGNGNGNGNGNRSSVDNAGAGAGASSHSGGKPSFAGGLRIGEVRARMGRKRAPEWIKKPPPPPPPPQAAQDAATTEQARPPASPAAKFGYL